MSTDPNDLEYFRLAPNVETFGVRTADRFTYFGDVIQQADGTWKARVGWSWRVFDGFADRFEAAAHLVKAKTAHRSIERVLDQLGDTPTVERFREFVETHQVPPAAMISYGECGDHDIRLDWEAMP